MAALAGPALGGDNDGDDEPIDVTLARLGIATVPNNTVAVAAPPACGRGGGELLDWLRVYYINLDTRPDRRARMEAITERDGIERVTERFAAVDTTSPTVAALLDWQDDPDGLSDKEYACALSHFGVWAKIAALPPGSLGLVLEDDVVFLKSWRVELARLLADELPDDWELLFLDCLPLSGWNFGRRIPAADAGRVQVRLEGPVSACSFADAYLLTPAAAATLLAYRPEEPLANAETLLLQLQDRGKSYATMPRLALQLWENSDIQPNTRVAAMAQFYTHEYHKRFPATIYDF